MNFVGIDLDEEKIYIAVLNKKKDLVDIKCFDINDINSSNVNSLYICKGKKYYVSSGLDIQDVLIKNVSFEVKKRFFINKAVKFQNEFITNLEPSKTLSVPLYFKEFSLLKFFITTKDLLKKHLDRLQHINIDPDCITCSALSLCRFTNYFYKDIKDAFLIHIGQNKTSCVFMKNNMPEKTYNIKIGIKKINVGIIEYKKNKNLIIDLLTISHNSNLYKLLCELKISIINAFISFTNKNEDKYPLIITGNIKNFVNIDKFLQNEKTLEILISEKLKQNPKINQHAISIGLSLNSLLKDSKQVQFRKEEFTSNKTLINIGKKLFFLSFFVLFILSIAYLFGSYSISIKEKIMHKRLINLQNYEKKYLNNKNIISIKNFKHDLNEYEKQLIKQTKDFPYFLKVPNVSQTLSWLNNFEYLKDTEIISFNYELIKYPDVHMRNEPYLAKIEVEFKTKTPSIARSFYDSLMKGEGYANPQEKITWNVNDDIYKTSFYLKLKQK